MEKDIWTERPNLFEPNVYISMVVKLEGALLPEAVCRAVADAYAANEATLSRVVLEADGRACYEKMQRTGCKIYVDCRDWRDILRESEKRPFDLSAGELVRTYICPGVSETTLFVHVHHLAGDGKSVLILIEDIVNSLAGKPVSYKPMVCVDGELLAGKTRLPFIIRCLTQWANRSWGRVGKAFSWEEYYAIHQSYWESRSSRITVRTYSVGEIKARCRNGVTLNSYLITDLLREHPQCAVVGIPVSIREDNRAMSNQTSGIEINYRYRPERTFEENLACVHKKIYKKLRDARLKYFVLLFIAQINPSLMDGILMETHGLYHNRVTAKMADIMSYTPKRGRDIGVTNLMRIEFPCEYEQFRIADLLFIPPKVSYAKQVIGIVSIGDRLNVSRHGMEE